MPGALGETEAILRYLADELGPQTHVDLMAQYYPAGLVGKPGRDPYQEIDRHLHRAEYERVAELAEALGLQRLDRRSLASGRLLAEMYVGGREAVPARGCIGGRSAGRVSQLCDLPT